MMDFCISPLSNEAGAEKEEARLYGLFDASSIVYVP
jgi:hypothetical protein